MSVEETPSTDVPSAESPTCARSASYLPCRECGEGSLIYDPDRAASVCRCCGAVDA